MSTSLRKPAVKGGQGSARLYIGAGIMFAFTLGSALLAVSYLFCPAQQYPWVAWAQPLCKDEHWRYLVPLLIPTTAWFVIANWVGWEYFRYA